MKVSPFTQSHRENDASTSDLPGLVSSASRISIVSDVPSLMPSVSSASMMSDVPNLMESTSSASSRLSPRIPMRKNGSSSSMKSTVSLSQIDMGGGGDSNQETLLGNGFKTWEKANSFLSGDCIRQWKGRGISVLGTGISFTFLMLNLSVLINELSATFTGVFAQGIISSGFSDATTARIRQIVLTVFGQVTFFYLSQFFANDMDEEVRNTLVYILLGMWGANLGSIGQWFWKERQINAESHITTLNRVPVLGTICNRKIFVQYFIKVSGVAGALSQYASSPDERIQSIALFLAGYFSTQIIGSFTIRWMNRKIEKHDVNQPIDPFTMKGSYVRVCKIILMTISYLGLPLCFPSYVKDHNMSELGVIGLAIGLFDGIIYQAQKDRITYIPFNHLSEFQKIHRLSENSDSNLNKISRRISQIAFPLYAVIGISGFTIWQEIVLANDKDRVAIGSMLAGFLSAFITTQSLDLVWDPVKKKKCQDWLMRYFTTSPRILGVRLLYMFLAISKTMKIDSEQIRSDDSVNFFLTSLAWWAYGTEMWLEYRSTSSENQGSPITRIPLMVIANGTSMFEAFLIRETS